MLIFAFSIVSAAVLLGAVLLAVSRPRLGRLPRARLAATHGSLGILGLIAILYRAGVGTDRPQAMALVIGLLAVGLMAGATIYAMRRARRRPPPLVFALHVLFAGMGYLLFAGLSLG
jgi:hypothetical protein